jgi:hypothetical protein
MRAAAAECSNSISGGFSGIAALAATQHLRLAAATASATACCLALCFMVC